MSISCHIVFNLGQCFFLSSNLELKYQLFLILDLASVCTETTPSTLLGIQLADYRYCLNFHNHMNQFLTINLSLFLFISFCTHTLTFFFSMET